MALKIALVVCCTLEFLFVPLFLKVMWPNPNKKSLLLKMICSSLFVAIGVLSMYITGNFSQFAIMMLIGLALGWFGDFFLHVSGTVVCFGIGFTGFLIGHIVYISAYVKTLTRLWSDYNQFNFAEMTVIVVLLLCALIGAIKYKIKMPSHFVKVCIGAYFTILAVMFVKASSLGFNYMIKGASCGWLGFLTLCLGSLSFMISDILIGIIMFGGQKKNYPLKIINIVTYFVGQVLLALSILVVRG